MHYALHTMHIRFSLCVYTMGYPDEKTCFVRFMPIAEYMEKKNIFGVAVYIREGFCLSVILHFVRMRGGEGPARIFFDTFS